MLHLYVAFEGEDGHGPYLPLWVRGDLDMEGSSDLAIQQNDLACDAR